jgi:hypothetical protein
MQLNKRHCVPKSPLIREQYPTSRVSSTVLKVATAKSYYHEKREVALSILRTWPDVSAAQTCLSIMPLYHLSHLVEILAIPSISACCLKRFIPIVVTPDANSQKFKFPRDVPELHKRRPVACQPFHCGSLTPFIQLHHTP